VKTLPIEADVIFQLDRQLKQYGGFGAYARKDQLSNRFLSEEITQLQGTATYVPSIFLGIAAFLLHILLSRLISTQREQIAVLKAFGYSNVAIGWHYLKFLLVIGSIGTLLGTGLGLWYGKAIVQNYTRFFSFHVLRYEASLWIVGGAIAISSGAAILGALVAVRTAVSSGGSDASRTASAI
jgi:putative ABC transport system permease protein